MHCFDQTFFNMHFVIGVTRWRVSNSDQQEEEIGGVSKGKISQGSKKLEHNIKVETVVYHKKQNKEQPVSMCMCVFFYF